MGSQLPVQMEVIERGSGSRRLRIIVGNVLSVIRAIPGPRGMGLCGPVTG